MASQCFSLVRGRVLRATALDGCGRPRSGACSSIVSEGFISVGFTANTDEGEEISVKNAAGKVCIQDTPCPVFKGYTVEIAFCEVNPSLYAMLTGQESVFNGAGDAVGFRVNSDISACDSGVALELWSSVPGVKCSEDVSAEGSFGYLLVPFLQGGTLGDFTLENDAVTFTISGAATKTGSAWDVGPYNVVRDDTGTASKLLTPITNGDHLHVQYTDVAPPTPSCDCTSSGTAATGATAGEPGTWTPADSYAPANLAALTGVTATPTAAWTTGEYVVLEDATQAHWDGDSWEAGAAP